MRIRWRFVTVSIFISVLAMRPCSLTPAAHDGRVSKIQEYLDTHAWVGAYRNTHSLSAAK